ncbi:TonB-dependent receptor domain-containing protein [uncultured Enterovirga sp.]|uniref:TonB-dependent receptor n=1 Tax=uncultured Enterovirga sp. TaxID=2026352 RepID=UPI0035CA24A8
MVLVSKTQLLTGTALALTAAGAFRAAEAQTALPQIVVTSPSPILTRRTTPQPAPPRVNAPLAPVRNARSARPVQTVTPAPPAASDPLRADTSSFPVGILPVVADTFAPVTVVPRSEIIREQPKTLGDALFDKPGISGTSYAPGAANRPIIRGLDNYRVRIQENGIGVHDVSPLGEDHAVPINPLVNDRIEVIRGPATLRYGSQAIGGVVSAENNRIPSFIPQGGYAAQVLSGYSSVDNGGVGAATVDAGDGNVAFHADGFKSRTDDYQTPRGRQFNSASQTQGGAVGYSFIGPNGFLGASFSHYDARYQIPGGEAAASRTQLDPTQQKVQIRGEYRFDSGPFDAFRFWVGGSSYKHNERGLDEDGHFGVRATFKNREVEARFELQHVPVPTNVGTLTGAVGLQTDRTKLGTSGEAGGLLAPTDSRFVAGYLFEQFDFGNGFKIQAAGRSESSRAVGTPLLFPRNFLPTLSPTGEVDGNGDPILAPDDPASASRRRKFMPVSAAIGALQALPYGFEASLTGQYVERAPAAPELYSRGAHDATATFEIGDPNLKLERARTIELGLRRAEGPFRLDATGYYTRYTGFIYKRLTGTLCGDEFTTCGADTELQQIVYSQQNATFYGAEIGTQLDVIPIRSGFIGVEAQYDFVRAKFDDGTNVPRIPPHRVGGGVFWREGGWFARLNLLHAFDHRETAPYETFTKGYDNLRAEVSYTRPMDRRVYGISELTIGLRGDNLLDDDIRNSASFKKDEILLPGRSARLFLNARF